jgi:hypothetical protein
MRAGLKARLFYFKLFTMAFTLAFSVTERNDNKLLTITDTTGEVSTGTATGWGSPNPLYSEVVASGGLHTLELNINVTTSDGTVTYYDTIDLYTEFGPFASITDLVFPLDCSMLKVDDVAIGTSEDSFPDGIYDIEYIYDYDLVTESITTNTETICGKVRNGTYELLRKMTTSYEYEGYIDDGVLLAIFANTYLDGILVSDAIARRDSVTAQLYTLERLLINESSYEI